jgi:hypothetical protein
MTDAPDNIADLRRHLERALHLLADRADDYTAAREYHEGKRAEVFDSRTVAEAVVSQSKMTPLSLAHIPVDVIADKVELSAITATGAGKRNLETWAEKNGIDDESAEWIHKACMFGDYYVLTDPTGFDDDDVATIEDVDSVGLSPLSTIVVYDKKTGRKKLYGLHVWDAGTKDEPVTRAILYYDDASVKLYADGAKTTDANEFHLDVPAGGEDEDAYLEHDGGQMLLAHLAIGGRPYGVPLHKKAFGPQDAITKINANNLVNVDSLGLPSRWALLDPTAELDDDIDDDFGTDGTATPASPDSRRDATTGRRTRTLPGTLQMLRGVKETGTYEASQSDPFLANLEFYIRAMAVACGIPLFEFDLNGEQPSGEARRRAEARANRTAQRVRRQATAFFREIAETVLGLTGAAGEVTVTFAPLETATDKEGLELVGTKILNGVPVRQALLEAGYTDEQVKAWYPEGAPAFTPALIKELAGALQALGQAETLGAIDQRVTAAMLPELFEYAAGQAEEGPLGDIVTDPATQAIVTSRAA